MAMNGAYHSEYGGGPTASQTAPDGTPRRLSARERARAMRIEGIRDRSEPS